jgi:hypothetical protein
VAGGLAAGLVTPMDVVKTRLQKQDSPYKSISECYKLMIKNEGYGSLFKGAVPRMAIVSPLYAITLLVYEFQKKYFPM